MIERFAKLAALPTGDAMKNILVLLITASMAVAAELPVREVVLYKHGVGFFERSGRLGSGESRTLDAGAATGMRFRVPRLQQQFREYLATVAASRSTDRRSVYIDSTDAKEREIVAAYMVPAAVWKSSYRLIFGASGPPVLEGWAIVD